MLQAPLQLQNEVGLLVNLLLPLPIPAEQRQPAHLIKPASCFDLLQHNLQPLGDCYSWKYKLRYGQEKGKIKLATEPQNAVTECTQ